MFRGVQSGRVDDKHRLKFPTLVHRRLLEVYGSGDVFITSANKKDVLVFPVREWEAGEQKLGQSAGNEDPLDAMRKQKIAFQMQHHGTEQSLDSQGRVLIPAVLREAVGMRSEVMMVWQGNRIALVAAERYQQKLEEMELDAEDHALAARLGLSDGTF